MKKESKKGGEIKTQKEKKRESGFSRALSIRQRPSLTGKEERGGGKRSVS